MPTDPDVTPSAHPARPALQHAWAALGGDPARVPELSVHGPGRVLPGPLPTTEISTAAVGAALLAAAELAETRTGERPDIEIDTRHVAAAVRSERALRVDGRPVGDTFDPLSTFLETRDGWVRTHANYPHHRAALLAALGGDGAEDAVRGRAREWAAEDLEEAVVGAGGVAAAMRTPEQWRRHPQGRAVHALPLLDVAGSTAGTASPLPPASPGRPADGVRVLDLTRVIAGPVGTRMLAALGADVLRVDNPGLPEIPLQALDTGPGKRSTLLDLRDPDARRAFDDLLATADVLVQGYRPGALAALGLDPDAVAERHPRLVTVTLSAWGGPGPWQQRRGFDSLVQSASGIAALTGEDGRPGVLPAQVLDHATGYLVAAAALRGLTTRHTSGRPAHARLALARTAAWLLATPPPSAEVEEPGVAQSFIVELDAPVGRVRMVTPPGSLAGTPLAWPHGPAGWGADAPAWR